MAASVPELIRQQVTATRRSKRDGGLMIDALTALQVEKNAADARRGRNPCQEVGSSSGQGQASHTVVRPEHDHAGRDRRLVDVRYLYDVILTRDPFMHRIDITRATGVPMVATAEHEGVVVHDVGASGQGATGSRTP